VWTA